MILERYEDPEALSCAVAERFVRAAADAVASRGRFFVALSGGRTPRLFYRHLAAEECRQRVLWSQVEFFWGDERAVPPDSAESNFRMAHDALLQPLGIGSHQVHRIAAERGDHEVVAREYQETIASVFGVGSGGTAPAFDLILLGLGADGHTASLFPGTPALDERRRWVVANPVASLGGVRLTMTTAILNRGREVVFAVAGADKAKALRAVLDGPSEPRRLPAQLVRPQGRLIWLVDREAAASLGPAWRACGTGGAGGDG
jgi:6-phosphogluconolactonase